MLSCLRKLVLHMVFVHRSLFLTHIPNIMITIECRCVIIDIERVFGSCLCDAMMTTIQRARDHMIFGIVITRHETEIVCWYQFFLVIVCQSDIDAVCSALVVHKLEIFIDLTIIDLSEATIQIITRDHTRQCMMMRNSPKRDLVFMIHDTRHRCPDIDDILW